MRAPTRVALLLSLLVAITMLRRCGAQPHAQASQYKLHGRDGLLQKLEKNHDGGKRSLTDGGGDLNVDGTALEECPRTQSNTGYFRDNYCRTGPTDTGTHTVCAKVTDAFLKQQKDLNNDLITPRPEYQFPGLKDGEYWCLCAIRFQQGVDAGIAPFVHRAATHEHTLQYVKNEDLKEAPGK